MNRLHYILREVKVVSILSIAAALMEIVNPLLMGISLISISHLTYSTADFINGVVFGFIIWFTIGYCIISSISIAMESFCSQSHGANNSQQIGIYFIRANILGILTWFPVLTIFKLSEKGFELFLSNEVTIYTLSAFIRTMYYGYPAYCFSMLAFRLLQAQCLVMANLVIIFLGCVANLIMQYIFLYVYFWGAHGTALAITISFYINSFLYTIYILSTSMHRVLFKKLGWSPFQDWWHFTKNAFWIFAIQICTRVPNRIGLILLGFVLKDTLEVTIYGYYNDLWGLYTALALGFGIGASTRVGNLLGANEPVKAKHSAIIITIFGSVVIFLLSLITTGLSKQISFLFTGNFMIQSAFSLTLKYASVLFSFDSVFIVFGVFYGCGLSQYSGFIYVIVTLASSPLVVVMVYNLNFRVVGMAIGIQFGLAVCCVFFFFILLCSSWEKFAKTAEINANLNVPGPNIDNSSLPHSKNNFKILHTTYLIIRFLILLLLEAFIFVLIYRFS